MPGVAKVEVDFKKSEAHITMKSGKSLDKAAAAKALRAAGFGCKG
jgi:hypothetical protein